MVDQDSDNDKQIWFVRYRGLSFFPVAWKGFFLTLLMLAVGLSVLIYLSITFGFENIRTIIFSLAIPISFAYFAYPRSEQLAVYRQTHTFGQTYAFSMLLGVMTVYAFFYLLTLVGTR